MLERSIRLVCKTNIQWFESISELKNMSMDKMVKPLDLESKVLWVRVPLDLQFICICSLTGKILVSKT